jgi:hypothetical protein
LSTHSQLSPLFRHESDDPPHSSAQHGHDDEGGERAGEDGQTRLTRSQDGGDEEGLVANLGDDLYTRTNMQRSEVSWPVREVEEAGVGVTDDHDEGLIKSIWGLRKGQERMGSQELLSSLKDSAKGGESRTEV